ncbi:MAG: hypothetical protein ACTH0V_00500 [Microbacteriaceae bacterium]
MHSSGAACGFGSSESLQHQRLKHEIAQALTAAGWHAEVEWRRRTHDGELHIADVSAERADVTVAFEVQLSPQSLHGTAERHLLRLRSGIDECFWLFGEQAWRANEPAVRIGLPATSVDVAGDAGAWAVGAAESAATRAAGRPKFNRWRLLLWILHNKTVPWPMAVDGTDADLVLHGATIENYAQLTVSYDWSTYYECCGASTCAWHAATIFSTCDRCGMRRYLGAHSKVGVDEPTINSAIRGIHRAEADRSTHCYVCLEPLSPAEERDRARGERRLPLITMEPHRCRA